MLFIDFHAYILQYNQLQLPQKQLLSLMTWFPVPRGNTIC